MRVDAEIAAEGIPTVRFFTWKDPAISLGLKQPAPDWVKTQAWKDSGLFLVERPTGGGMAFHGSDVSVGVVIPRSFNLSLAAIMDAVGFATVRLCEAMGVKAKSTGSITGNARITYCLTEISAYAVFAGSKKLAGFALRRFPQTWLIEGSLLVRPLPRVLVEAVPGDVSAQLDDRAVSLAEAAGKPVTQEEVMALWAKHWGHWWQESLVCQWTRRVKS